MKKKKKNKRSVMSASLVSTGQMPNKGSGLVLKCDYRESDFEHWPRPTELQLARLAAQLARTKRIKPQQLVQEAWELYWASCRKIQADYRDQEACFEHERQAEASSDDWDQPPQPAVPQPKKYPVTFREMEKLLLPKQKGRTAERASLIREYIFAQLVGRCFVVRPQFAPVSYWELEPDVLEKLRQQLKEEVTRQFEQFRKNVYSAEAYTRLAASFLEWHRRYIAAKKAAAARKRWGKGDEKQDGATEKPGQGDPEISKKNLQTSG